MANKTQPGAGTVGGYLKSVSNARRRKDAEIVMKMLRDITGKRALLWGNSIIGFDKYHYVYASGQEGDWPKIGLSARAQNLSIYIMPGFAGFDDLLNKLGKHKTAKSCLYVKWLDDVDLDVLYKILERSYQKMQAKYG